MKKNKVNLAGSRAVGLLTWSADRNCTSSLVGSKYALTAADCVLARDGTRRASSLAQPELVIGGGGGHHHHDTYVLLELDAPLDDTLGKLLLPTANDLNQRHSTTPVQMVGFDDDVTRTSKPELTFAKCTCSFPGTFSGPQYMLHHDCDTSAMGSPGSVLLVRYTSMETYIIGIHTNLIGDDAPEIDADAALDGYNDGVAIRGVLGLFVKQHLESRLKNATMESNTAGGASSGSGTLAGPPTVDHTPPSASPTSPSAPVSAASGPAIQRRTPGSNLAGLRVGLHRISRSDAPPQPQGSSPTLQRWGLK